MEYLSPTLEMYPQGQHLVDLDFFEIHDITGGDRYWARDLSEESSFFPIGSLICRKSLGEPVMSWMGVPFEQMIELPPADSSFHLRQKWREIKADPQWVFVGGPLVLLERHLQRKEQSKSKNNYVMYTKAFGTIGIVWFFDFFNGVRLQTSSLAYLQDHCLSSRTWKRIA